MTKPILLAGKDAAKFVGVSHSWFRELAAARGLTPSRVGAGRNGAKYYTKLTLLSLKRETRHRGRPKPAPANSKGRGRCSTMGSRTSK